MTITIPKEKLESWKKIRSAEDVKQLKAITGLERSKLYYVLSTGHCTSKKIASQIIKFHEQLEKDVKNLLEQVNAD